MTITLVGDFADPLSFLASQRVEQIRSLDLHDVHWFAVESDRERPMGGRPLQRALIERAQRLAAPGEAVPAPELRVPNSRAATSAYAESFTDGVPDAMRCALYDALWAHGRDIGDPNVIRQIVVDILNPLRPAGDIDWRVRANLPIVPLGDANLIATTRRLGLIVSMGRGPLTLAGQLRIDKWRQLWLQQAAPTLPLLLTDVGESLAGEPALAWLADLLPHRHLVATAGGAARQNRSPIEMPGQPAEIPVP